MVEAATSDYDSGLVEDYHGMTCGAQVDAHEEMKRVCQRTTS